MLAAQIPGLCACALAAQILGEKSSSSHPPMFTVLLLLCVKSSLYFGSQSLIRDAFIRQFILICALPFKYSDHIFGRQKNISIFINFSKQYTLTMFS